MIDRIDTAVSLQKQFIGDISHQLKTPLSILKGQIETTLKKARSIKEYEDILISNLEEVDTLINLIEHLLLLARLDIKEVPLNKETIEIVPFIETIVNEMQFIAEAKDISIGFLHKGTPKLEGDPHLLRQVFFNLLDNAIKYCPSGSRIFVEARYVNNTITIAVKDNGPGIPEQELSNIFKRFYRIPNRNSEKGFGLGLSICRSIVEMHKGTILVRSKPNIKTEFIITLPL